MAFRWWKKPPFSFFSVFLIPTITTTSIVLPADAGAAASRSSSAAFSTGIVGGIPMLVRDFIHSALYNPEHGYFAQKSGSVGLLEESIRFNSLKGRKSYLQYLDKLYKEYDIAWFTPVEIFKPWYAHAIAEAILRTADLSVPLKIYEIGGGSGTCAKSIMDYLMLNAPPKVYKTMSYISVEISSSLAEKQLETVGEVQSHISRYSVQCRDAANKAGWGNIDPQPCWVIMLDVLDNLPHDLIYSGSQVSPWMEVLDNLPHDLMYSGSQVSPWMEVWVEEQKDSHQISELYKPLNDPLVTHCMEILNMDNSQTVVGNSAMIKATSLWSKIFPKSKKVWLPTGCLQLLEVLHRALPKMSLITSDFSYLPDVQISGERAPLVSTKKNGRSEDYKNYLDAKGDADIFFPTDFRLLERIDHYCSGWKSSVLEPTSSKPVKKRRSITLDTASFMNEFGIPTKTRTKDGYNPLFDDYKNTKFYLSVPTHNR